MFSLNSRSGERRVAAAAERRNDVKHGWRVPEWAAAAGCSRAFVYNLLKEKKLESVKLGRSRIILTHPADYLAALRDGAAT
jgi:hypothetical protein